MAEKFTCPRRVEMGMHLANSPFKSSGPDKDSYIARHGLVSQKTGCSYCGSMNPEDFMNAVRAKKLIGPTDKSYKFYVNDHEGKFYTQHLSEDQGWEFKRLWEAHEINWDYPGAPYVRLFIPGPSTSSKEESNG